MKTAFISHISVTFFVTINLKGNAGKPDSLRQIIVHKTTTEPSTKLKL